MKENEMTPNNCSFFNLSAKFRNSYLINAILNIFFDCKVKHVFKALGRKTRKALLHYYYYFSFFLSYLHRVNQTKLNYLHAIVNLFESSNY